MLLNMRDNTLSILTRTILGIIYFQLFRHTEIWAWVYLLFAPPI